jgi:formylglycine-generating enzyme required for sulfatase activity
MAVNCHTPPGLTGTAVDECKPITIPDVDLVFLPIPPGRFQRGSTHGDPGEFPPHTVRLTHTVWLGQNLVTQQQYFGLMHENPSYFEGEDLPVETVSWDDAQEFCRRLTERQWAAGRIPPEFFFRLPTEAEWEHACRTMHPAQDLPSAPTGPENRQEEGRFCYGDDPGILPEYAWFQANSAGTTHPVGTRKGSACGLYDLHGNVSEWCLDWYAPYTEAELTDPFGPETGERRVRRGGSWASVARRCRTTDRAGVSPHCRCALVGFRVAGGTYGPGPYTADYRLW